MSANKVEVNSTVLSPMIGMFILIRRCKKQWNSLYRSTFHLLNLDGNVDIILCKQKIKDQKLDY